MADVPDANLEPEQHYRSFKRSEWFLRGWTLQELLTPREMRFYDIKWELIGPKRDLLKCISEITGISPLVLHDREAIRFVSVAERMSWASKRTTTRIEDVAYCLLGIFDVNMPLLYGEGMKAFRRLQEEIIRTSDDQSILAWEQSNSMIIHHSTSTWCGCLASSPAEFAKSGNIVSGSAISDRWRSEPYQITNKGLQIDIDYITVPSEPRIKYVALHCHDRDSKFQTFIALLGGENMGSYCRSGKTFKTEDILMLLPDRDPQVKEGQFTLRRETVFVDLH